MDIKNLEGIGIKKLELIANAEEKKQDKDIKLKCLDMVMAHGNEQERACPWLKGAKLFNWIKFNNPDIEVK